MRRTNTNLHAKKKQLIAALKNTLGIVTTACEQAGISRKQYYIWIKDDEKFKAEVEAIEDIPIDFAESKLHKQIEKGDTTAIIFYLKTKGKKRGYVEKQEIGHSLTLQIEELDGKL